MTDDYSSNRKDMMVKKAIRDYAKEQGIGVNNYGRITNWQILDYMITHKLGLRWISKNQIKGVRSKLSKQYNEKIKD